MAQSLKICMVKAIEHLVKDEEQDKTDDRGSECQGFIPAHDPLLGQWGVHQTFSPLVLAKQTGRFDQ